MGVRTQEFDAVAYCNPEKNIWRAKAWAACRDTVERFCGVPARDAMVLYLPGENDLDISVACRKGFRAENFIAVERDARVVKHLRAQGRTVIGGGLNEVLEAWPDSKPVHVVFADLQSNFGQSVWYALAAWRTSQAFARSVLVLNMQRGMESPQWADALASGRALHGDKHRADAVGVWLVQLGYFLELKALVPQERPLTVDEAVAIKVGVDKHKLATKKLEPYRSARVVMDSCLIARSEPGTSWAPFSARNERKRKKYRGLIAAALAIRTSRIRGHLRQASV